MGKTKQLASAPIANAPGSNKPDQYCFVIHSVPPYCYEFYQIFALPSGFQYRQRYDERWVEHSLRNDLNTIIGKEVLIVFWNASTATLYPVRWGRVSTAQKVGRIFYFEYVLTDFVGYKADANARSAQILAFNDTFTGFHQEIVERTPPEIKTSVFATDVGQHLPRTTFNDLTNWGNIVDAVAQAPVFKGMEFLKIIDLREGLEKTLAPFGNGYQLRDRHTYRLRVFQIVPNPLETSAPHDIELNSFVDQIQILRKRQTAVGKYDVLTYLFKLSGVPSGEQTAFEIRPASSIGAFIFVIPGIGEVGRDPRYALRPLRAKKSSAADQTHQLASLFCVCDVVDSVRLYPEFVRSTKEAIVKRRVEVTFKQHPRRRTEILQSHGRPARALVLLAQNNSEWNASNDRATQKGIVHGIADNGKIIFAAANATRKLARRPRVEQDLQPGIERQFKRAKNREQSPIREYRLPHRDWMVSSIQRLTGGHRSILGVSDRQAGTLNVVPAGVSRDDALILAVASFEQASADMALNFGQCPRDSGLSHSNPMRSTMEIQLLCKSDNSRRVALPPRRQ
jgi:hypothetical protein